MRPVPRQPRRLSGPAPGPHASHASCCPAAAARDSATKESGQRASEQPGSPRPQTPPRHSVMSGFPVCACERTLPFGSPADQGSEQSGVVGKRHFQVDRFIEGERGIPGGHQVTK